MKIQYSDVAKKQFIKLDKSVQKRIKKYLEEVATLENPRSRGKCLVSNLSGYWRYRIGDYRIICQVKDDALLIDVVFLGHRKKIYE